MTSYINTLLKLEQLETQDLVEEIFFQNKQGIYIQLVLYVQEIFQPKIWGTHGETHLKNKELVTQVQMVGTKAIKNPYGDSCEFQDKLRMGGIKV